MNIGEEQEAIEVPIPMHPDDIPAEQPVPSQPATQPATAPEKVPA